MSPAPPRAPTMLTRDGRGRAHAVPGAPPGSPAARGPRGLASRPWRSAPSHGRRGRRGQCARRRKLCRPRRESSRTRRQSPPRPASPPSGPPLGDVSLAREGQAAVAAPPALTSMRARSTSAAKRLIVGPSRHTGVTVAACPTPIRVRHHRRLRRRRRRRPRAPPPEPATASCSARAPRTSSPGSRPSSAARSARSPSLRRHRVGGPAFTRRPRARRLRPHRRHVRQRRLRRPARGSRGAKPEEVEGDGPDQRLRRRALHPRAAEPLKATKGHLVLTSSVAGRRTLPARSTRRRSSPSPRWARPRGWTSTTPACG